MQINDSIADLSTIGVQKLSIQLIDIERAANYIKEAPNYTEKKKRPLDEIIQLIVEIYNIKQTNKKEPVPEGEKLLPFSSQTPTSHRFGYSIFTKTTSRKTRLARTTEQTSDSQQKIPQKINTIFLLFYYRTQPRDEIFAVSSDYAWEIVRPCINYEFTRKVAMRILNPDQITKISRRCLVGSNAQEVLTNPSGHELCKITTLYYLVESFIAAVKVNSSLHILFDELQQIRPKFVKISTGLLRIEREIPLEAYPNLLKLLSKYDRGKETYSIEGDFRLEEEPDPKFEFLNFLQEVSGLTTVLNERLVTQIISDFNEDNFRAHLYYKYLQDFLSGNEFSIQLKPKKHFRVLSDNPPTIATIVTLLNPTSDSSSEGSSDDASFHQSLKEVLINGSLRFVTAAGESITEKLINCLEGEVRYHNKSYFKIRGMWYLLRGDYHMLLQQDFKQTLRSLLVGPKNEPEAMLPLPWSDAITPSSPTKKQKKEETYNRLYTHTKINNGKPFGPDEGYIVLDQVLPFNIEPCDIVRYTPTITYLIHVKASFKQETRDACSQILNAAKEFRSTSLHQTDGFLQKLWKDGTAPTKDEFRMQLKKQLEHLGKENFLRIFFERRLVFVYAYVPTAKVNLTIESSLPTYLTSTHLKEIDKLSNTPKELFQTLQSSEYLDEHGRLTSKFYSTTQDKFKRKFKISYKSKQLTLEAKANIYNRLSEYSTTSNSTLAKLEVLQLNKEIRELGFELRISEITPGTTEDPIESTISKKMSSSSKVKAKTIKTQHATKHSDPSKQNPRFSVASSSSSPSSSSSQLPPESELIQHNPLKKRNDNNYEYQAADIATIQSELFKIHPRGFHLLTPLKENLTDECEKSRIAYYCSKIKEKPILGTYNKDEGHWVMFYLVKTNKSYVTCLYKDSYGGKPPQQFQDAFQNALQLQELKVLFIYNTSHEQTDGTSCGVFALENMRILINQLENADFINNFKLFSGFCTQERTMQLRKNEFAFHYVVGTNRRLKKEQHHKLCRRSIRTYHQQEVDRLGEILRAKLGKTIKILGFDEDLDRINESNTIAVELVVDKLSLRQNNYRYLYCFRSTNDISIENLHKSLQRLLNIPKENFTIEKKARIIKLDPALVVTISKKEKMIEFPDPIPDIDETEFFQTLYLETEEQQKNVRKIIQKISQKHLG